MIDAPPAPEQPPTDKGTRGYNITPDELLTLEAVAARLKVTPQTVVRWRKGKGCGELGPFPEPDAWAGVHPRWYAATVARWSREDKESYRLPMRFKLGGKYTTLERVLRTIADAVEGLGVAGFYVRQLPSHGDIHAVEFTWPKRTGLTPELLALAIARQHDIPYLRNEPPPIEFLPQR